MNTEIFNHQLKQFSILCLILLFSYLVLRELYIFIPGILGALTVYILSRGSYFQLVYHRHWKKPMAAWLFLMLCCIFIFGLIFITYHMLNEQVQPFLKNPAEMIATAKDAIVKVQKESGVMFISEELMGIWQQKLSATIPSFLNDTFNLFLNIALLLFILYYMLVHGKEIDSYLIKVIPLKNANVHLLAMETKRIVKVSALGIPIISLVQGLTATIGYYLFGVNEYILWGFLTGVLAFFPIVGTMIVYVPLVLFMFVSGSTSQAVGLGVYSLIVTGNIDYVVRITLLNKMGHIHPVITVIGVIAGLGMFGFLGLIFGPLLVSYVILLIRIYTNEFLEHKDLSTTEKVQ